jgi:hypothetical protein
MRSVILPPANGSKEAVALRKAAFAFVKHEPVGGDDDDKRGMALNRDLLRAALRYAMVAVASEVHPDTLKWRVFDALNDPDCIQAPDHDEDRKVLARRIAEALIREVA